MLDCETSSLLNQSNLGKTVSYETQYNPALLFPISRQGKRDELGIGAVLPFTGHDIWTHYEVSWLNLKGKPQVAIAEIIYPCESTNIIESKSMKLYFNSFNQSKFHHINDIQTTIERDLSKSVGQAVEVTLLDLNTVQDQLLYARLDGLCLDDLDIECTTYLPEKNFLSTTNQIVSENLFSNLLKSNCLITNQPDWASIQIQYHGSQIDHAGLLKYLISFRNHNEFHEQCIERIFTDILIQCQPDDLVIYGRYTRRGGLDINVLRSKNPVKMDVRKRLIRQ